MCSTTILIRVKASIVLAYTILSVATPTFGYAQMGVKKRIAVLEQLIASQQHHDTVSVGWLAECAWLMRYENLDRARLLAEEVLKFSTQKHYLSGEAIAWRTLGYCDCIQGYPDSSFVRSQRAQALEKQMGSQNFSALGYITWQLGQNDLQTDNSTRSLEYFQESYRYFTQAHDTLGITLAVRFMGNVQQKFNSNIADKYYRQAITICSLTNDSSLLALRLHLQGYLALQQRDYARALPLIQQALAIQYAIDEHRHALQIGYRFLAGCLRGLGLYGEALAALGTAEVLLEDLHHRVTLSNMYCDKAQIFMEMGQKDRAEKLLHHSLQIARAAHVGFQQIETLQALCDFYQQEKRWREALVTLDVVERLQDSIRSENRARDMVRLQAQFEVEQHEKKLILAQEELKNMRTEAERDFLLHTLLIGGCAFIVVIVMLLIHHHRLQVRLQIAENLYRERKRISSDLHDEIGSGLTQISMLSDISKHQLYKDESVLRHIETISTTAQDLIKSVSNIVWTLNAENDTLGNFLAYIREYMTNYLAGTGINVHYTFPNLLEEYIAEYQVTAVFRRNMFLVVKEALANILKHAEDVNRVECHLSFDVETHSLTIRIADNGVVRQHIQGRQFGNGLKTMRRRVEELGGTFVLTSAAEHGTVVWCMVEVKSPDK